MTLGFRREALDQPVALMAGAAHRGVESAGVGLVHDHALRAGTQEVVAPAVRLDVVGGDDDEVVDVEERLADAAALLEPADGRGQHQLGLDVELVRQLRLPLLSEVRWAQHGQAPYLAAIKELAGHEPGFDRLADADVGGDEQADHVLLEGHEGRHELVRPRLAGDAGEGAEGSGAGPEAGAYGVAQQTAGAVVADALVRREPEMGGAYGVAFEGEVDASDLVVGTAEAAEDEEIGFGLGLDNPFASTGLDEGSDGVGHERDSGTAQRTALFSWAAEGATPHEGE